MLITDSYKNSTLKWLLYYFENLLFSLLYFNSFNSSQHTLQCHSAQSSSTSVSRGWRTTLLEGCTWLRLGFYISVIALGVLNSIVSFDIDSRPLNLYGMKEKDIVKDSRQNYQTLPHGEKCNLTKMKKVTEKIKVRLFFFYLQLLSMLVSVVHFTVEIFYRVAYFL